MPKTPACSPLKSAPKPQRFTQSLLLSYADSPAQWSYVLPADDTSDADEDDEGDDELDIRAASPTEAHGVGFSQSPGTEAGEGDDNRASARRNSWTNGSTAKARSRLSVALRTLQSARQALVNAKRRSFELGERSVSATIHQLRSCSLSSMRFSENNEPDDATPDTDNNNTSERPSSLAAVSNIISSQAQLLEEQQEGEQAEPEQREQEEIKQLKQQQQHKTKKKRRIRTASYQSALAKYLPVIFTRSSSARSEMTEEGDSGLSDNNNSASNDNNSESTSGVSVDEEQNAHQAGTDIITSSTSGLSGNTSASRGNNDLASNSNESASDTEDESSKQDTAPASTISSKIRRLAKWPLRQRHHHRAEPSDNQSEHEA